MSRPQPQKGEDLLTFAARLGYVAAWDEQPGVSYLRLTEHGAVTPGLRGYAVAQVTRTPAGKWQWKTTLSPELCPFQWGTEPTRAYGHEAAETALKPYFERVKGKTRE